MLREFFSRPLSHRMGLGIVIVIAIAVIFVPPGPTDWELNTNPLSQGLQIYESHNFVYPPWSLILFWPYRWMTAAGARVAIVLVIAFLHAYRGWSIGRFLAVILSPFFIFSMYFSNLDALVLTLPIVLWEIAAKWRGRWFVWGLCLAVLMLKPQGALLVMPYLFWQQRHQWQQILASFLVAGLIILPISFVGSPPLLFQWLENISNPSEANLAYWSANNISLTADVGFLLAIPILLLAFGGLYLLMRRFAKEWTHNHSYTLLILLSLLLSPYSSNQSLIAAMAFAPSMIATILHYLMTFGGEALELYLPYVPFWVIAFGLVALWFMPSSRDIAASEEE